MDEKLWKKCVEFHGHECPGLAIGYRVSEAAAQKLGFPFSTDEEVVCVTENDACGVDAVQLITGCSMGKGNLIYRDTGKMAFSFFDRNSGKKVRIVLKPIDGPSDREWRQNYILNANIEELFDFKIPTYDIPEEARLFKKVTCEMCGESAAENKIRLIDGKRVCLDCFHEYTRGW